MSSATTKTQRPDDGDDDRRGEVSATMRAVARDRYGSAERLELRTVAVPTPSAGEVLVEVAAAGVDRGVWHLMTGLPYLVRFAGYGLRRPKQPVIGMDVAGRVVAVGHGVSRFRPGDRVFGIADGSFAEFAIAAERKLAHLPDGVSFVDGAATPVSGLAALQAVRDVGRLRSGQRVLVLGASGGVGSFAVQIAQHLGAEVTGVASSAKLDLVRALGAERVIDYRTTDPLDGSEQYDLIVDAGGRNSLRRLRLALAPRGTLVIVGGEGGGRVTGGVGRQLRAMLLSPFVRQRLTTFISKERHEDVATLGELIAAGAVTAAVGRTYPLAEAPTAIADLEAGRTRGKAVVAVAG